MKAFLLVALAACVGRATGPDWPTPHAKWDGGESIAPHNPNPITIAAEAEIPDEPVVEEPVVVVAKPVAAPVTPTIAPVVKPPDEPINLEETIIEVDE